MDVAAGRRVNARMVHPAVDRGYGNLSRIANRGILWIGVAGVLALTARRRAAVRGLASLTAASVVANLIGKKVFGGDRPLLSDIPIGRQLRKSPTSGSFPSGHSASAAAFATGVGLESPRAGAAIAPVAAAVSYSRLHTGAHWLSDVLGGVALGAAVAGVGKLLVPARARPQSPAEAPTAATIALPALPDGRGAFIVVNGSAGPVGADPSKVLAEHLPHAHIHVLADGEELTTVLRRENHARVLGVYGGDGSVAAAAGLARERRQPLLVLPGGTYNHFATTAGLDSLETAIRALQSGRGRRIDVAELDDGSLAATTVLNTASVGIYPSFVAEREKRERRLGKRLAALVAAVKVLTTADTIELTANGRRMRVWSIFVGVNRYYPADAAPQERPRLDDGVLDVRVLSAGAWARTSGIVALAFGRRGSSLLQTLRPSADAIETFTTDVVDIVVHARGETELGIAHDGEATIGTGSFSVTLRSVPAALSIYAP
jgi:diacylglycerol kinase family enzyme/membrane-associated phospholipid phosphatase